MWPKVESDDFHEKLKQGQDGERLIASKLIERNVTVVPLYQFENSHAPYILAKDMLLTMPDLLCFNDSGACYFIECKLKKRWVKFKGKIETGINLKHYYNYKRVTFLTGNKEYLCFTWILNNC